MNVILPYFYSGDVSIKVGATLTVCVPIGASNNLDALNFEINLVDVTRVEALTDLSFHSNVSIDEKIGFDAVNEWTLQLLRIRHLGN